jgi:hypothetical protein
LIDERVADRARAARRLEAVPGERDQRERGHGRGREPGTDRSEPAGQRQGHRDGGQRAEGAERVLRDGGQPERDRARDLPPPGATGAIGLEGISPAEQQPQEAELDGGAEERIWPHIARECCEEG